MSTSTELKAFDGTPLISERVYLAGRIRKNDWRHRVMVSDVGLNQEDLKETDDWPISREAVLLAYDYVGPYFVRCDHGCGHGHTDHGCGLTGRGCVYGTRRKTVLRRCLKAIDSASVLIAWIDDRECFGTLTEIGYAKAAGKRIVVGFAGDRVDMELWLAACMADECHFDCTPDELCELALPQASYMRAAQAARLRAVNNAD